MKGTIFEPLAQIYILKYPSRKSLPDKILPKAQILAISFYTHILKNVIKLENLGSFLGKYQAVKQSIRQCYANLFYSLGNKSQIALDFIACIICLLSQIIFSAQNTQQVKQIETFFQKMYQKDQNLRDYLYIMYLNQTLGYIVGKQSSKLIFQRFIVSEDFDASNFATRMKVKMQFNQIKQLIEKKGQIFYVRPRFKNRNRQKNNYNYQEDMKSILRQNQIEIEQQNRFNKKYQIFKTQCIIQGKNQLQGNLIHNQQKDRNLLALPLKKDIQQNKKNFYFWKQVIDQMKNKCLFTHRQNLRDIKFNFIDINPNYIIQKQPQNKYNLANIKNKNPQNFTAPPNKYPRLQKNSVFLPYIQQNRHTRMTAPININKENMQNPKDNSVIQNKIIKLKKSYKQFLQKIKNRYIE